MGYMLKMNRKEETPSNGFFGGIKGKGVSHDLYYPFAGMYDILGDEKKEFVRGLSEIFDFNIVEEDETRIRIIFTEKNYVYHSSEDMQKTYADFVVLTNRMEKQISMVPVHHEVIMGTTGSGMSFTSKRLLSKALDTENTALITDPKAEFANHH